MGAEANHGGDAGTNRTRSFFGTCISIRAEYEGAVGRARKLSVYSAAQLLSQILYYSAVRQDDERVLIEAGYKSRYRASYRVLVAPSASSEVNGVTMETLP